MKTLSNYLATSAAFPELSKRVLLYSEYTWRNIKDAGYSILDPHWQQGAPTQARYLPGRFINVVDAVNFTKANRPAILKAAKSVNFNLPTDLDEIDTDIALASFAWNFVAAEIMEYLKY